MLVSSNKPLARRYFDALRRVADVLIAGFLCFATPQVVSGQVAECRKAERATASTPDLRVLLGPGIRLRSDSLVALAYDSSSRAAPRFHIIGFSDPSFIDRPWAAFDIALIALLIGIPGPVLLSVDSVTWDSRRVNGQAHVSVACGSFTVQHQIGAYALPFRVVDGKVRFHTSLAERTRENKPIIKEQLHLFPSFGTVFSDAGIAQSLERMRSDAARLQLPVPNRIDVFLVPANYHGLRLLGITRWNQPIDELTLGVGPLVISQLQRGGGISRHEIVHAVQQMTPMHPFLYEGQASFLGGVRGASLGQRICDQKSSLLTWTAKRLQLLLEGEAAASVSDVELSTLNGVLAGMLMDQPHTMWTLTPTQSNAKFRSELVTSWSTLLASLLADC